MAREVRHTPHMKSLHIEGRRWFQRTYGNTYHSVRIWKNGQHIGTIPFSYGYGDSYLQSAIDFLKARNLIPANAEYGTRYLREELGGTYSCIDVTRKSDL